MMPCEYAELIRLRHNKESLDTASNQRKRELELMCSGKSSPQHVVLGNMRALATSIQSSVIDLDYNDCAIRIFGWSFDAEDDHEFGFRVKVRLSLSVDDAENLGIDKNLFPVSIAKSNHSQCGVDISELTSLASHRACF